MSEADIYRRLNSLEATIAGQTVEIQRLREDVQEVVRVVVKGNGESLVTRLRIVERDLDTHGRQLSGLRAGRSELDREGVRGRWAAITAGIATAGAIAGSIITHLIRSAASGSGAGP